MKTNSRAAYASPGWLLFARAGTLFAQTFDAGRLELTGQPVPVADNVSGNANGFAAYGVSDTRVLAYRTGAPLSRSELAWFDRNGKRIGEAGAPAAYRNLELSPDKARLAVDITDDKSGTRDVWVVDLARPVTTRLTYNPGSDQRPVWSPDGNRIAFQAGRIIYVKPSNGTGDQELLLEGREGAVTVPYSFSPDGRFLLFSQAPRTGAVANLWLLPLEGDRKPSVLIKSPYWDTPGLNVSNASGENHGQFSPDGKWLVYTSNESGNFEVYVESYPTGAGKWQVSTAGGMQPRWRRDGKEIFYIAADGKLMAAAVTAAGSTFQPQTPVALFQTSLDATTMVAGTSRQYDVSADGQRFIVNTPLAASSTVPITVVLNWQAAPGR